jgi:hypothetical protein
VQEEKDEEEEDEEGNEEEKEEGGVSRNGNPKTPKTVAKTTDKPISDAIILSPYLPCSVSAY